MCATSLPPSVVAVYAERFDAAIDKARWIDMDLLRSARPAPAPAALLGGVTSPRGGNRKDRRKQRKAHRQARRQVMRFVRKRSHAN